MGSWGPAHSIYIFDFTMIDEVDIQDIRCFFNPLLRWSADPSILRIIESLIKRKCLFDRTFIRPRGLSYIPFISLLVSSWVKKVDYLFSSVVLDNCPTPFYYARLDFTIFVCIPEGHKTDPAALDKLFYYKILRNVRVISSGISMMVCRPGEDPVIFREGSLSFDHDNKPQVSISNKEAFFYKKHPPPQPLVS